MLYLKIETAWAFVLQSWGYLQLAILISHCCRSSGYNFKSIGQAKVRDILKKCRVNSSYCQGKKVHLYWGCGKVIIEKSRCGRCLWNRNWDLGWIWADWQYWKKRFWADYEQLLRVVFSCFHGQKKFLNVF